MKSHQNSVQRRQCRNCGAPVDHHVTEYGRPVGLDIHTVPVTTDLHHDDVWPHLWEDRGPRIGWVHMSFPPQRSWRDLRTEHRCSNENEHKLENKEGHKNE